MKTHAGVLESIVKAVAKGNEVLFACFYPKSGIPARCFPADINDPRHPVNICQDQAKKTNQKYKNIDSIGATIIKECHW